MCGPKLIFVEFNTDIKHKLFNKNYIPKIYNNLPNIRVESIDSKLGVIKELQYDRNYKIETYHIAAFNDMADLDKMNKSIDDLIDKDYVRYGDMFVVNNGVNSFYAMPFVKYVDCEVD